MHPRSLARRRPSAPLVISVIALFVALGGVGYAATFLPANSVGTAQLQNNAVKNWKIANQAVGNWKLSFGAVGSRKIENGAVGTKQINATQVQSRITGTCSTPGQGIDGVGQKGDVTCGPTSAPEFGTTTKDPVTIDSTKSSTQILSSRLPAGNPYLMFSTANVTVTGTATNQWVKVSCTLSPGGTAPTQTNTASVHLDGTNPDSATIPFTLAAPQTDKDATGTLTCSETHSTGAAPTVTVAASLNTLETASNK